ncbi:hypothetical protein DERF_014336 [Dermatophagoides farinae]|uniref:Uncharacterized protein n=1 Tax=Dermatophagoides farinae TaxID=6954 RepID=A0A922HM10_DERFA|nr:hypothetical protein DERF_014336 [Dermatophagoides farinae]
MIISAKRITCTLRNSISTFSSTNSIRFISQILILLRNQYGQLINSITELCARLVLVLIVVDNIREDCCCWPPLSLTFELYRLADIDVNNCSKNFLTISGSFIRVKDDFSFRYATDHVYYVLDVVF